MSYVESFRNATALELAPVVACLRELGVDLQRDALPAASLGQMHTFYDRLYRYENHFLHHFAPFICQADSVFEVPNDAPHLLDLGCGVGTQSYLLAARNARITGIDIKPSRVQAAEEMQTWFEQRFGRSLEVDLEAGDAFEFMERLPAESFDGVFTQFALAYMKPYDKVLHLIDRVLKPGGRVLFREFNAGNIYNRLVSRVDWLSADEYVRACSSLNWTLSRREYYWLIPKPIINLSSPSGLLANLDNLLAKSPLGRALGGSMSLVFTKPHKAQ